VTAKDGPFSEGHWQGYRSPFRHWRASNLLGPGSYKHVSSAFAAMLEASSCSRDGPYQFAKSSPKYDALILPVDAHLAGLFTPLFSEGWIRSLHEFLSIPETLRIDAALHSSPQGSRTGWIHTDLCSGWFDEASATSNDLLFVNRHACDYFTGRAKNGAAKPREYVRAATLIYYLCNEGWSPGDGGETALYGAAKQREHTEVSRVAPIDNTLLVFECSPHSYHRFLANPGRPRNSIIMWLHASVDDATARWSEAVHRSASR
jgi:hypothetical protein